jgi:hypothetical protein
MNISQIPIMGIWGFSFYKCLRKTTQVKRHSALIPRMFFRQEITGDESGNHVSEVFEAEQNKRFRYIAKVRGCLS